MVNTKGNFFVGTLASLNLTGDVKAAATNNAVQILEKIVETYGEVVGKGQVGSSGSGLARIKKKTTIGPVGLVYGRIQSGKTRAMITSTALAFDNGFKIAVVLTSNINDLVSQTHGDFTRDLPGVTVFTKDDELDIEVDSAKLDIDDTDGRLLMIGSKGAKSLKNIITFLTEIGAYGYPMVVFDDEGDQASLDTNQFSRSSSGNLRMTASAINKLILKLRKDFPAAIYVSVTGTPQALLLQNASTDMRPSFVFMLPHGKGYIGGGHFFDSVEPEENDHRLISIVPPGDLRELLSRRPIPIGLKAAIVYFLIASAAAKKNIGTKQKGYQFLCHPSLKNNEQSHTRDRILDFLTDIKSVLQTGTDKNGIKEVFEKQYVKLKEKLKADLPLLSELIPTIVNELRQRKLLVINASNSKRKGIEYGSGLNFLIGGNTLGRGIAIPNLLVTYYVRFSNTSQIDTMHQHARMFGYRNETLKYTQLFITKDLYYRFRDIQYSDTGLRGFIENKKDSFPNSFPVEYTGGLRPTRRGVLDVNNTEAIWPGMQIYPNYIRLPQSNKVYKSIMSSVSELFDVSDWESEGSVLEKKGTKGVIVNSLFISEMIAMLKTKSNNAWNDKTVLTIVDKLVQKFGDSFDLRFRTAERTVGEGGFLSQGTISGREQNEARMRNIPTLWLMAVTGKPDSATGAGENFVFPTLIVPNSLPALFLFNKD